MIRLRSTDVWLNYVHGECMARTLSVRFVVDRPKLHYLDMLWICCGLLLHNCCGLVARLLHNLSWTCRNVNLLWLCCRRCSKLVLLYIFCIFHLVDNYCCSVGELYNKSPPLIELMEFEQLLDSFDLSYSLLRICCGFVDTTIWQVHNKSRHWSSICCVTCRTIYNTKYGGRAYSIDAVRRTSRVSSTAVSLDNKGRVLLTTRSKLPRWNFLTPQFATNFQTKVP